ncbi:hypothetical protein [Variovorax sp. PBL-E5]|uniref:hypothetical protein n=1 Tax=Variovorax sp. PBL-E5 TaxID=434014 RepID=UPI001316809D|nr:hypothetical protein [Variovorax sp. PBL-E5]VTU17312.1 Lipoyl synthase [Variovorax sp. PBL-E5]
MNEFLAKAPQRGAAKTRCIPIHVDAAAALTKPDWIRVRLSQGERFREVKRTLREANLHTVCEEASCPNIGECFGKGTATFMVLGDLCTRRCPFCDVAHGRPSPPDPLEPQHLADTVARFDLKYVVITSGAAHGVDVLTAGQYLQPRPGNLAVERYVAPAQFEALGFSHAACGPLVRSSYHADRQAHAAGI